MAGRTKHGDWVRDHVNANGKQRLGKGRRSKMVACVCSTHPQSRFDIHTHTVTGKATEGKFPRKAAK